jgi:hypothetical protein
MEPFSSSIRKVSRSRLLPQPSNPWLRVSAPSLYKKDRRFIMLNQCNWTITTEEQQLPRFERLPFQFSALYSAAKDTLA